MNDQMRKKALFRAKLKEHSQKLDQRIKSPLVRYNELDQPVCRVCNVILKSESFWQAHQVSRKHHEAIDKIKTNSSGRTQISKNLKSELSLELPIVDTIVDSEHAMHFGINKPQPYVELCESQPSFELPANFFDNHESKRPKIGPYQNRGMDLVDFKMKLDGLPNSEIINTQGIENESEPIKTSNRVVDLENKAGKGTLPEGFFDDNDADLRARGIQPVKLDVNDEYKEFEKSIQDDLTEFDERLEEDEFDAAVTIEEAEFLEQKEYRERVETIKKKKLDMKTARSAKNGRKNQVMEAKEADDDGDESSSDGDFAVDWRAKHL